MQSKVGVAELASLTVAVPIIGVISGHLLRLRHGHNAGGGSRTQKKATIPHATKKVKLTDSFHEVLRKFLGSNETSFALPRVDGRYSGVLRTKSSRSEDTDAEVRGAR